jgi:PAS domain S-box-containing protein
MSAPSAAGSRPTRPVDPYRALFDHLSIGAAHCRLVVELDQVAALEVLDSTAAFEPVRDALPQLIEVCARVRELRSPQTHQLRGPAAMPAVSVYPLCDPGGDPVSEVMVVIDDATARDHTAQQLRESQNRFAQAFHGNAAAMVIARRDDLRIVDVNPRWLEMFGAERSEVIGRTPVELGLITVSNAQARIAQHRRFSEGYEVELELTTRRGTAITVLASAKPIEIAEGRCTLTTLIDITARKQAEQAFEIAFSASPAGMMLVDVASGSVVAVNRRLLEMTGYRSDQLIGRTTGELSLVARPSNIELVSEIERTGGLDGIEVELVNRAGPAVFALASTEMMTLRDKVHRLSVFTDITARKRAEASLRELNSELERRVVERTQALQSSNRDLEMFSYSVSHDLRAPLRAMVSFSQILLDDFASDLPAEARQLLARIAASGGRLRDLIEDLLAFARLSSNELVRSQVELDPLVHSVLDELIAGRSLGDRLSVRVLPLGSCHADPSLLRTVWTNLIDNALKYSQHRAHIAIEIGRELRDPDTVYYVRDNGIGFDMAHADRLFGVFQRLHSSAEFEGTGIGLANVRRIVERHHGWVAASSQPDRGSQFEFTLGAEPRRDPLV